MSLGSTLLAALGIGFLIFIHELGHFLAARTAGVKVDVFSLGFGPRLCGFTWQGTDFRLALVPFGGYVMVAGMDAADRRYGASASLWGKPIGKRALFWSGGVLMNFAFALVAFPLALLSGVDFTAPIVGTVQPGGAAWEADIVSGDRLVAIAGKPVYSFDNALVEIALAGHRPVALTVRGEGGADRAVVVSPRWSAVDGRYELGVQPAIVDDDAPLLAVMPSGAAARAGITDGSALIAINGVGAVGATLPAAVRQLVRDDGAPVTFSVRDDSGERDVVVTPSLLPNDGPWRIGCLPHARVVLAVRASVDVAARLGLRQGDVVLAIDGRPFVVDSLEGHRIGPLDLKVAVRRDGAIVDLSTSASREDREAFVAAVALGPDDAALVQPMPGLPGAAVGLQSGDRIDAVDGEPVADFVGLRDAIERSAGREVTLTVRRARRDSVDRERAELTYEPPQAVRLTPIRPPTYDFGATPTIANRNERVQADTMSSALAMGGTMSLDLIKQLYVTTKRLLTGDVGAQNLGGIIRIGQISYRAAERGPTWLLYLLAMLSMNLAFVNLLPVPILDGGHLVFLAIEAAKGSPVSPRVHNYSQMAGLVFVLFLVLFVTYNDILQLL
ncbi:MAG: hypothetical protein FJ301_03200 [Planctomycetes bacterium]|nr:hypothetical protein [Planctomycetota bacterium]